MKLWKSWVNRWNWKSYTEWGNLYPERQGFAYFLNMWILTSNFNFMYLTWSACRSQETKIVTWGGGCHNGCGLGEHG